MKDLVALVAVIGAVVAGSQTLGWDRMLRMLGAGVASSVTVAESQCDEAGDLVDPSSEFLICIPDREWWIRLRDACAARDEESLHLVEEHRLVRMPRCDAEAQAVFRRALRRPVPKDLRIADLFGPDYD